MKIQHTCIRASAGSGKTFQLAHRYISLLAQGVPAERIMAMTFSRAAAGEIFDSIIEYLRQAAASDEGAKERNQYLICDPLSRSEYLALLKGLLHTTHRLHIGTLDSFTVGIIKSFPLELGIPPQFSVMDENSYEALQARQRVLDGLFYDPALTDETREAFLLSFKESTFGADEKNLHRILDGFIETYQSRWAERPEVEAWGNAERIFPDGSPWLNPPGAVQDAVQDMHDWLEQADLPSGVIKTLTEFTAAASDFDEKSAWDATLTNRVPLKNLAEGLPCLAAGSWTFNYRNQECVIDGQGAKAMLGLLHHCMHILLHRTLKQTQGLGRLLEWYDTLYDSQVRRAGRLSFTDTQYLLHPLRFRPTRNDSGSERLYIDYRLDAKLDHWLWDEFQDTSDLQWDVLSGLIGEALQDAEEQRSVFYVGDIKQAIYGWRGGNPKLFQEILDKYPGRFVEQQLHESRRTPSAILDVVNQVFSNLDRFDFPAATLERWNPFPPHRSAVQSHQGYMALVEPPCPDKAAKPTAEDRFEVCAQLLREIKPGERGLKVGILTRSNSVAENLANYLRGTDLNLPIAHEGQTVLADNAAVALMLALLQLAAHPGDHFAWQHLAMSPLREHLFGLPDPSSEVEGKTQAIRFSRKVLNTLHDQGFHGLVKEWAGRLNEQGLNAFEQQRLRQLEECARAYDAAGERDCTQFMEVVRKTNVPSISSHCPVRIMTVHKSKGLGFDVVILPELVTGKSMSHPKLPEMIKGSNWMLRTPLQFVQGLDPTLSRIAEEEKAEQAFEAICNLYVAMTRSKQALYCVTSWPAAKPQTEDPAYLLKYLLCDGDVNPFTEEAPYTSLYEHGDPNWMESISPSPQAEAAPPVHEHRGWTIPSEDTELPSPSQIDRQAESVAALFGGMRNILDFGTAVHALFEQVEWLKAADCRAGSLTPPETGMEDILSGWSQTYDADPALKQKAIAHFQQALASEAVQQTLVQPAEPCTVWREKEFSLLIDGKTLNGVIDRAHLYGESGGYTRAEIIDYKTNQVESEEDIRVAVDHYRPQLEAYARVLHSLTNISIEQIELKLVFTLPGRVEAV